MAMTEDEVCRVLQEKLALRKENENPERPGEDALRGLDSSIKRNTTVLNKLKKLGEDMKTQLIADFQKVNMSKYVSEAVDAIVDAKFRSSDLNAAVIIISEIHKRYSEFSAQLVAAFGRTLSFQGTAGSSLPEDDKSAVTKRRLQVRLFIECFLVGIFTDPIPILTIAKELVHLLQRVKADGYEAIGSALGYITAYVRSARELLLAGSSQSASDGDSAEPLSKSLGLQIMPEPKLNSLKKMFEQICIDSTNALLDAHATLLRQERANRHTLNTKGVLSERQESDTVEKKLALETILKSVTVLFEILRRDLPQLKQDELEPVGGSINVITHTGGTSNPDDFFIFEDPEERFFYESLPDLEEIVPAILLGKRTKKDISENAEADNGEIKEEGDTELKTDASLAQTSPEEAAPSEDVVPTQLEAEEEAPSKLIASGNAIIDSLFDRLPQCLSRETIDAWAVDFCHHNSKGARKRLVDALLGVPRSALDLLPYYSRALAIVAPFMGDVKSTVVERLLSQWYAYIKRKDQLMIESKIKTARYLAELTKFQLVPYDRIYRNLKLCTEDFSSTNIEIICSYLEVSGSFLFRNPETHVRTRNVLEILGRMKTIKNLDQRQSMLIDNAIYMSKPQDKLVTRAKERSHLELFLRKILIDDLNQDNIGKTLKICRKLKYPDHEELLCRICLKVCKNKFINVPYVASIVSGLSRYQEGFVIKLVDDLMEEIRKGLESNAASLQQRRIAHIKFLGELYNYAAINNAVVFETLYAILTFGYETPERAAELDPQGDFFRIRLIIVLLSTCGKYFTKGSQKVKLDRFLMYFQRYCLSKVDPPVDLEFDLQDLYELLRPNLKRFDNLEDACKAVEAMEREELEKLAKATQGMDVITEEDEEDEGDVEDASSSATEEDKHEEDAEDAGHPTDSMDEETKTLYYDDDDDYEYGHNSSGIGRIRNRVSKEEEDMFDHDLANFMQEAKDTRRVDYNHAALPVALLRQTQSEATSMSAFGSAQSASQGLSLYAHREEEPEEGPSEDRVALKMIFKKGSRAAVRQVEVPADSMLATYSRERAEALQIEREQLKKLVLESQFDAD